jgi:hypothetical protein
MAPFTRAPILGRRGAQRLIVRIIIVSLERVKTRLHAIARMNCCVVSDQNRDDDMHSLAAQSELAESCDETLRDRRG